PVGLVWIGLSTPDGDHAWKLLWKGDRIQNKENSAEAALEFLLGYLTANLPPDTPYKEI
ncbi:MAG: CinA family protein, partial [Chloroflexi bacterium]|nr:CinA family protein [Chloroflexota bacterium]